MALKMIPTYGDGTNEVRFIAIDHSKGAMPGFTHRIIVNRVSVGFLSAKFKPSAKVAEFFLQKRQGAGA